MSGWWYGQDGSRRWIDDDPPAPPPPVILPPPAPLADAPTTDAALDALWQPTTRREAPIVRFSEEVLGLPLWPAQAALLSEL